LFTDIDSRAFTKKAAAAFAALRVGSGFLTKARRPRDATAETGSSRARPAPAAKFMMNR